MTTLPERASADGEWWMIKMRLGSLAFDCLCRTYNARYVPGNTTHAVQLSIYRAGLCSNANSFLSLHMCPIPELRNLLPITTFLGQDSAASGFILPRVDHDVYRG